MDANTLKKALAIVTNALKDSDIDPVDQVELMINLNEFLNPEKYDKNIEILKETNQSIHRR